jgi:hypothetical protein
MGMEHRALVSLLLGIGIHVSEVGHSSHQLPLVVLQLVCYREGSTRPTINEALE